MNPVVHNPRTWEGKVQNVKSQREISKTPGVHIEKGDKNLWREMKEDAEDPRSMYMYIRTKKRKGEKQHRRAKV